MLAKKKFAREPMLYIHQPQVNKPEAPMQHNYISPKRNKENPVQEDLSTKKVPSPKRRNLFKQELMQNKERYSTEEKTQEEEHNDKKELPKNNQSEIEASTQPVQEKTKFKDMTIEGKIDYLVNAPTHAPDLRCEVKTEKRNYRGVIKGKQDGVVLIRVGKRSNNTEVPIEDILAIRMLGF